MDEWRERMWNEAEELLQSLCAEFATGEIRILLTEGMPPKPKANPFHMPFAIVLNVKDVRRFTERHGKILKSINAKMNEWAKENIGRTAVVDVELKLWKEIKTRFEDYSP